MTTPIITVTRIQTDRPPAEPPPEEMNRPNQTGDRLRAWRMAQPCPHCDGVGRLSSTLDPERVCWICHGTGMGLSQAKAAGLAGVPFESWRNWERGRRTPHASALALLERVLSGETGPFERPGTSEDLAP